MSDTTPSRRRVRTGCLTCRSRKVKCDEARPSCYNCNRVNRACLYQPPQLSHWCRTPTNWPESPSPASHFQTASLDADAANVVASDGATSQEPMEERMLLDPWTDPTTLEEEPMEFNFITGEWGDLFTGNLDDLYQPEPSPRSARGPTPRIPKGLLPDVPTSFQYFLSDVEPPFITPWDSPSWELMKPHLCRLGTSHVVISASIGAVEALYQGLSGGGDASMALPSYFAAKSAFLGLVNDEQSDLEIILVAIFLLCCFEIVAQHETVSNTLKQKDTLVTRLENKPKHQSWSPVSSRIICWLHLFHTKALHLGGRGILSPKVLALLEAPRTLLPLTFLRPSQPSAPEIFLQALEQTLFSFYYELQRISADVSSLNRHHRPRGVPEDEVLVDVLSQDIQQRLEHLWQGRPWLLDLPAEEIVNVPEVELRKLILLTRLCTISYYAELIYHARGHGKSLYGSENIADARERLRDVLDLVQKTGSPEGKLHPAFMWSLFMYTVESTKSEEVKWASECLQNVSNVLWNSPSVKELTSDLGHEQLRKGTRVDSRYFCIEKFGTVPPFM